MSTVFHSAGEYRTPAGRLRLAAPAQKDQLAAFPGLGRGSAVYGAPLASGEAGGPGRAGPAFATRLRHENGPGDGPGDGPAAAADGGAYGFADLLDVINPLQHIPLVSTLYRAVTGDEIQAPMRIAGGALFGGPIGFVAALANVVVDDAVGADLGEMALAALTGDEAGGTAADGIQVAAASPARRAAPDPPPATAAAPAGPVAAGDNAPLTGDAALRAVATDLRALATGAAPGPGAQRAAQQAAQRGALVAREGGAETASEDNGPTGPLPTADLAGAATLSAGGFAERMMRALDRYEDMAKSPVAGRAGAVRVETEL